MPAIGDLWNGFFHHPEAATTIAVFRILLAALLIVDGLILAKDAKRFYGPRGIFSIDHHRAAIGKRRFSLFNYLPPRHSSTYLVFALHFLAATSLLVGFRSRTSAALVFATLISIHHRNPFVIHSGDCLLRILTFLLCFSHAGDALSLDYVLAHGGTEGIVRGVQGSPWCLRLMQLQISIVYLRSVSWKLQGTRWRDGTAAYYPPHVPNFTRLPLPRWASSLAVVRGATWGTLFVELALGTWVWLEDLRYPVLAAGVGFHLLLELLINLQLFGWTMISSLVLFVDAGDLERFLLSFT